MTKDCIKEYCANIASLSVDSAARMVAKQACDKFPGRYIMINRDPGHCVDLLVKDLPKTSAIKDIIDEAREVRELVSNDHIDSIRLKSIQGGYVELACATVSLVDTRMNMGHDIILAARSSMTSCNF